MKQEFLNFVEALIKENPEKANELMDSNSNMNKSIEILSLEMFVSSFLLLGQISPKTFSNFLGLWN